MFTMKRFYSFIFAAAAVVLSVASCQEPVEEVKALEIAAYTIAESAEFGDKVDFTVTAEVAPGFGVWANSLTFINASKRA